MSSEETDRWGNDVLAKFTAERVKAEEEYRQMAKDEITPEQMAKWDRIFHNYFLAHAMLGNPDPLNLTAAIDSMETVVEEPVATVLQETAMADLEIRDERSGRQYVALGTLPACAFFQWGHQFYRITYHGLGSLDWKLEDGHVAVVRQNDGEVTVFSLEERVIPVKAVLTMVD